MQYPVAGELYASLAKAFLWSLIGALSPSTPAAGPIVYWLSKVGLKAEEVPHCCWRTGPLGSYSGLGALEQVLLASGAQGDKYGSCGLS